MYKYFLKRAFDIVLSFGAIVILFVPMALIAIAVKLTSRGPILFVQQRIGRGEKPFKILKFRTMRTDAPKDEPTRNLTDVEKWATPVGKFLRKTGVDELPQIFNILVGQMSFVGPRPVVAKHDDLIRLRRENGANSIRPGLTGWAQINGRDRIPDFKKAELDGEYARKLSGGFFSGLFMDTRCIWGTIPAIFKSDRFLEDASENTEKTSERMI